MRNIDGSDWLRNPELQVVQTAKGQQSGSNFTLFADQVSIANTDAAGVKGKGPQPKGPGNKVMASRGAQ
jgi:hypothetical protein